MIKVEGNVIKVYGLEFRVIKVYGLWFYSQLSEMMKRSYR